MFEIPVAVEVREVENEPQTTHLDVSSEATDPSALVTIDEAKKQISDEIVSVLADKFNGKLSKVRHVDQKDMLF